MEAGAQAAPGGPPGGSALPAWLLGLIPVALLLAAVAVLALLDGPGLDQRNGIPLEEIAVERTELHPGEIQVTVRNEGPDPVTISQLTVNEAFMPFTGAGEIGRLESRTLTVAYPWIEGEAYSVGLLTSTGGVIEAPIDDRRRDPGPRPLLLRPDGAARHLRRRDPDLDRDGLAARSSAGSGRR